MKEQRAALHPCMIWSGNYFHHTANYHFTSDFIYVYSTIFFSTSSCLCQPSSTFFCLVLSLESDFFFKLLIVYRNSSTSNYQRHVKKKIDMQWHSKSQLLCVIFLCSVQYSAARLQLCPLSPSKMYSLAHPGKPI